MQFEFTEAEVNQILDGLSYRPFRDVYQLIGQVQQQVQAPSQAPSPAFPEPAKEA